MRRFLVTLLAALALCAPADARESMGITVSHSLSATTPDNPAFEIQPKHWNSNHIATINAVGSEISGAFGNGGGVTFALSADGNITAAAPAQTVQTQNFVAVIASGANGNGTFTSGTLSIKAGDNVTLSTGANVLSIYAPAPGAAAEANAIQLLGANTAGSTTASGSTIGWSGINVTLSGALDSKVVISAAAPKTGISGIIVSDATYTSGTVSFSNAGNITISSSVNGASQYIVLSGNAAQTVQSQNFVAIIASGGNGNGTFTSGTVSFKNGSNITFSTGANVISVFAPDSQTVQTQNLFAAIVSGANGNLTQTSGTLSVKAGNNITLSTGANVVSIHGVASQTEQTQNLFAAIVSGANGNLTQTSGTLSIKAGNNITLSTGANVVSIHGAAGGGANLTLQDSATTLQVTKVIYSNVNGVSFGLSTAASLATVTASVAAQSNQTVGMYATGNTTNNSSTTFDARTLGSWNALGAATVGFSNGSVQLSVPATSSIVGTSGMSVSSNGSTLSVQPVPMSQWSLGGAEISQAGSAQANSLVSIQPFFLNWPVAFSNFRFAASLNVASAANNSSAYLDVSISGVVYTRNASTLSSLFSFSNSLTQSWSSNATGTVTGVPAITATCVATTLTPGDYWIAVHVSTTNSATGGANTTALANTVSMILHGAHHVDSAANQIKQWGAQTNASQGLISGQGILSTGATRATIAFSDYVATGTRGALAAVYFGLRNETFQG